jgi:hypothetical protein
MSITPTIPSQIPAPPPSPSPYALSSSRQLVVVTDIDMTMGKMCKFMIKWIIASIPAIIISSLIILFIGVFATVIFGGLFASLLRR